MGVNERLFAWRMRRAIHPERFGSFGERSVILPPAVIRSPHRIHIGDNVLIHDRAWFSVVEEFLGQRFDPHFSVGDRTVIGRDMYVSCVGRIEIGADILIGDRFLVADTHHRYDDPDTPISKQPMSAPEPVSIGDGCHLSVGVSVLAGVTIGARSYVGAGTVVTKSVPPNSVVVGNPGRVVRHYDHASGEWVDGPPAGWGTAPAGQGAPPAAADPFPG
jgi:acetyltransferase-like isoleucine patch superfamily enzyme